MAKPKKQRKSEVETAPGGDAVRHEIAALLEREQERGTISALARNYLTHDQYERVAPLLHDWITGNIDWLRGGSWRAPEWVRVIVEDARASGRDVGQVVATLHTLRGMLTEFCAAQIDGLDQAAFLREVRAIEDYYTGLITKHYADQERKTIAAEQRKHRAVVEAMPCAYLLLDQQGVICEWNQQAEQLLARPGVSLSKAPFESLCAGRTKQAIRRDLRQRSSSKGRSYAGELNDAKGRPFPVELRVTPTFDGEGLRNGIAVMLMPGASSAPASAKAPPVSKELADRLEAFGVGIAVVRADGTLVHANRLGEVYLSGTMPRLRHPGEATGGALYARLHEGPLRERAPVRVEVRADPEDPAVGTSVWFDVAAVPVPDSDGAVTRVVRLASDITLRKRFEDQLRTLQRNSLFAQLSVGAAHRLRNPLSVVVGYAEIMAEASGALQPADAERVLRNALRCRTIVEQLLEFGRGLSPEPAVLDLNALIENQLRGAIPPAEAGRIDWVLSPEPLRVRASADRLIHALLGLLDNALWAAACRARVRTEAHADTVRVYVEDDGAGVAADPPGRVFEPFFTTRAATHNAGLGLSLAQYDVESFGGTLWLAAPDAEGGLPGACFVMELPAIPDEPARVDEQEAPPAAARILLVDDEADLLEMLGGALERLGHTVTTLTNGAAAVSALGEGAFDLAVLDIQLEGGIDGKAVYTALRESAPNAQAGVLFITADTLNVETRSFLDGLDEPHLVKPFLVSDFCAAVSAALDGRSM